MREWKLICISLKLILIKFVVKLKLYLVYNIMINIVSLVTAIKPKNKAYGKCRDNLCVNLLHFKQTIR